jgi:PAS domain S-box-containing protein
MNESKPNHGEIVRRDRELEKNGNGQNGEKDELRLFKAIVDSSSEAIAITDPEGRFVYINPAHEKLFGRSLEEAKKANYRDYYPTESVQILERDVAPTLERGESWEGILDAFDHEGRRFPLWERADTIKGDDGRMVYAFGIMHDVTRKQETEAELREYATAIEGSKDLIAAVDREYRYRLVNQAFLNRHGLNRYQVIGHTAEEILGKDIFHRQIKHYVDRCFKGQEINYEIELDYPKLGIRHLEVDYFPLEINGGINRVVTVIQDVTERVSAALALKKAYDRLEDKVLERTAELTKTKEIAEAAKKAKDEFLMNMGHELRTPLNQVISFTELAMDEEVGQLNHTQKEYLLDVRQSAGRLKSLLNDIIELSDFETGEVVIEPSPVDLKVLLEEILSVIKNKAIKKIIELSIDMDGAPKTVWADEWKLKKILYCLLSNAVKFSPDGSEVRVAVRQMSSAGSGESGHVEISVSDNGIGIEPGDLIRIFESFVQGNGTMSKRYQGPGLGLSLVKNFVELHGGRIWAESEGKGKGSVFRFTIPVPLPL